METRFVVVGSGYAGTLAAIRLARRAGLGRVTLVDPDLRLVERVRLHEALVSGRDVEHPLARWAEPLGITLVRGRVDGLRAREVVLTDGRTLPFDQCILATGSRTARTLPGSMAHAHALEPGALAGVRDALQHASRVSILGGGLTGIETAAEIAEAMPTRRVTLVTRALAPSLTPRARAHVERTLRRLGVELALGDGIEAITAGAVQTTGRAIPFDLAIDTTGFASEAPAFLTGARDAIGRVLATPTLASRELEGVVLAGDLATPTGTLAGDPMIRGCQSAMPSGAHAADVAWARARGEAATEFAFAPNGYCVSLGRRDGVVDAYGQVLTGRSAAWVKERIVRYTVQSMDWQARGWDYRWRPFFRSARRRALPAHAGAALTETSA